MYVVKKRSHHDVFLEGFCGHGNLMEFSRQLISPVGHVGWMCSVSVTAHIAGFMICEV